jgi:hypothetical protein
MRVLKRSAVIRLERATLRHAHRAEGTALTGSKLMNPHLLTSEIYHDTSSEQTDRAPRRA